MRSDSVTLGYNGPRIFRVALGGAAMSPGRTPGNEKESLETIHRALDGGVNLLDTADFYGNGHNELLIGKAIRDRRASAVLSVKFGSLRSPDGAFIGTDARPNAVKNFLSYSLMRLGVDYVDIYRLARLDPVVPIEETVGAIGDLVKAGYVKHIGLSEVGVKTIRRAHVTHPICDLQIEYSLMSRGPEEEVLPVLQELGIGMTAYGVLSHGLLSGTAREAPESSHLPRLQGPNFDHNQTLVAALATIAREKGITTSQLATAWVLAKQPAAIAIMGAKRPSQMEEALKALEVELSAQDILRVEEAVPAGSVAGTRYAAPLMKLLDSEEKDA